MSVEDNGRCVGYLRGDITSHTADALESFFERHNCHRPQMFLLSPGGDIEAAMRMGRTLRKVQAMAFAMKIKPCLSACTLVLAGASVRSAGDNAVGVHSYYRNVGSKSEEEATQAYDHSYRAVRTYLEEMRIPLLLLELSYSVPPWQVRLLTKKEVADTHLGEDDPVYRDLRTTEQAAKVGLPVSEYYKRLAKAEVECPEVEYLPGMDEESNKQALTEWGQCRERITGF